MRFLSLIFQVSGDFGFLAFAVSPQFVGIRFHLNQIDHASKILFLADGQLQRNNCAPKCRGQRFENAICVGAVAIHVADHD